MHLLNLANEILLIIAEELQTPDLNSFLKTNHRLKALLTPLLTNAVLNRKNETLVWAARKGNVPLAKLLLENGADIEYRLEMGGTKLLHIAVNSMHLEFVEFLLKNGANVNVTTQVVNSSFIISPITPLYLAVCGGCVPIAKVLLENGASLKISRNLLHIAVSGGNNGMVELLLDYGADINEKNCRGSSPLGCAIERKMNSTTKLLESRGAVSVDTCRSGY